MDDRPELYSTRQVADRLGVNDAHLRRLAVALGVGRKIGKQWVFTEADVDALRNRDTRPGPKPKDP